MLAIVAAHERMYAIRHRSETAARIAPSATNGNR
jgi:hypothetical protein